MNVKELHLLGALTTSSLMEYKRWERGFDAFWEGWGRDVIVSKRARNGWDCAKLVQELAGREQTTPCVTLKKQVAPKDLRQVFSVYLNDRLIGFVCKPIPLNRPPYWEVKSPRLEWLGEYRRKDQAVAFLVRENSSH